MRTGVCLRLGRSLSVRSYQSLCDFSCVRTRIHIRAFLPSCLQLKCFLLFVCFRLCWVFTAVQASSSHGEQGLLSSCGARCLGTVAGSVVMAHRVSCSAACRIFLTRDQTPVPCAGRQIPTHCTTREVPTKVSLSSKYTAGRVSGTGTGGAGRQKGGC